MNSASVASEPSSTEPGRVLEDPLCHVAGVEHRYGDKQVLHGIDLDVRAGQITALLGPNGSGKTTLFRLIATLMPIQSGRIQIDGINVAARPREVRRHLGIVFQAPSLDGKLTVDENIACQGALYGIRGAELNRRRDEVLERFSLSDRRGDRCESLSGGLKRRVELAKSLLHRPQLMLLDEPSTGLDPSARLALWRSLEDLAGDGTGVLLTTHLMEEAAKANRLVLFAGGRKVAEGSPAELQSEVGGAVMTVAATDLDVAEKLLSDECGVEVTRLDQSLRVLHGATPDTLRTVVERLGDDLQSVRFDRPSLDDVFIARTGKTFDAGSIDGGGSDE